MSRFDSGRLENSGEQGPRDPGETGYFLKTGDGTMTEAQKIDDGGPAFPTRAGDGEWYESETHADGSATYKYGSLTGMSLRDWFAGQAMSAIVANASMLERVQIWAGYDDAPRRSDEHSKCLNYLSEYAYEVADAMLAARKAVGNG